jgi:hypothetical protein
MPLNYAIAAGANDYIVACIAPTPVEGQVYNKSQMPHVGLINLKDTLTPTGLTFPIAQGSTTLIGTLRDSTGGIPTGVTVTITKPDGTVINQSTPYTNTSIFAVINNGTLTDLIVTNPDPGDWIINVLAPNIPSGYEFAFYLSTLPTADIPAVFAATLPTIQREITETPPPPDFVGFSMNCTWCTYGSYALAAVLIVIIAAAAAAGATLTIASLGAAAPAVVAIEAGTAALWNAFYAGLAATGTLTISGVAAYICQWMKVCPTH